MSDDSPTEDAPARDRTHALGAVVTQLLTIYTLLKTGITDRDRDSLRVGLVAAAMMPVYPMGFFNNLIPDINIFAAFKKGLQWIIQLFVQGLINSAVKLFVDGMAPLLMYKNPYYIEPLNNAWLKSVKIYFGILFLGILAHLVVMQVFPNNEDVDIQRMGERIFISIILVIISRELFGWFVAMTNGLTSYYFPTGYSLQYASALIDGLMGKIVSGIVVKFYLSWITVWQLLVIGLIFYSVLAVRMILIYTVYALFPIFIGMWTFDVGPGKYAKTFAELMFKVTAVLMMLGVIIAGMLSVGAAIAGTTGVESGFVSHQAQMYGPGGMYGNLEYGGQAVSDGQFASGGQFADSTVQGMLFKTFTFFAMLWTIIAVTLSGFGMFLSAGASSPGGAGGMKGGSSPGAMYRRGQYNKGSSVQTGFGGAGPGPGGPGGPGGAGGGGGGVMSFEQMDSSVPLTTQGKNALGSMRDRMSKPFGGRGSSALRDSGHGEVADTFDTLSSGFRDYASTDAVKSLDDRLRGAGSWSDKTRSQQAYSALSTGAQKAASHAAENAMEKTLGPKPGKEKVSTLDKLRSKDIAKPKYDDDELPGDLKGEDVNWAKPEKVKEAVPHAGGAPAHGYGQDPEGYGDINGESWSERHGGRGGAQAPATVEEGIDPDSATPDRYQTDSPYQPDERTADPEEMQGAYDSEIPRATDEEATAAAQGAGARDQAQAAKAGANGMEVEMSYENAIQKADSLVQQHGQNVHTPGQVVNRAEEYMQKGYSEQEAWEMVERDMANGELWSRGGNTPMSLVGEYNQEELALLQDQAAQWAEGTPYSANDMLGRAGKYVERGMEPGEALAEVRGEIEEQQAFWGDSYAGSVGAGGAGVDSDVPEEVFEDLPFGPDADYEALEENLDSFNDVTNLNEKMKNLEVMLEHQQQIGASPDVAAKRIREVVERNEAIGIGEFNQNKDVLEALDADSIPEALRTSDADRRILMSRMGEQGRYSGQLFRYEFDDGHQVWGKEMKGSDGPAHLVAEETMDRVGVKTPSYHYDIDQNFVRMEHIEGENIKRLSKADRLDASELDVQPEDLDADSYQRAVASMTVAGNHDFNGGNIYFDKEGEAMVLDQDFTGNDRVSRAAVDTMAMQGAQHAEDLGLDVSEKDIKEEIESLAHEMNPEELREEVVQDVASRMGPKNVDTASFDGAEEAGLGEEDIQRLKDEQRKRITQTERRVETVADNTKRIQDGDVDLGIEDATDEVATSGLSPDKSSLEPHEEAALDAAESMSQSVDKQQLADKIQMEKALGGSDMTWEDAKNEALDTY